MEAMLDLVSARGYEAVSVGEVVARAGGDTAEFESLFSSKQDCAVAVLEEVAKENLREVRGAFDSQPSWPDSLRAAAYAHAGWIAANPAKLRFTLLEMVWASELTSAVRDNLFAEYIAMVDAGREVAPDPDAVPAQAAQSAVGAIAQVVAKNFASADDLFALVPEMMYLAVRPYLGEETARRELTTPRPAAQSRADL